MTTRTETETKLLREEAQRLARENWKRTEISRALGVPLHTLARWAFQDRWRGKDLAAEGEAERLAALREQVQARQRALCGRSAEQLEYKSAEHDGTGPDNAGPDSVEAPDEPARWAVPELRVKTPPWAPGNAIEAPESASLWLAEDLMRLGLLGEAEKALRFTKNWLQVSKMVSDKEDEEHARRLEYQQQQQQQRAREKARCKALGLPDPDEVWKAQIAEWDGNNNSSKITTAMPQQHAKTVGEDRE